MGRDTIITITAYKRPYYFAKVVKSIEAADRHRDYRVLLSIDGGKPAEQAVMQKIAEESELRFTIFSHSENLGCAGNTGFILKEGFNDADRVIHLEEDIIVSKGFFNYMEYYLDLHEDNPSMFSISSFSHDKNPNLDLINHVKMIQRFRCVGWGMWKDRFEEIQEWFGITWKHDRPFTDANVPEGEEFLRWVNKTDYGSWGWPMDMYHRKGRWSVAPLVSKSRHIGQLEGTFCKGNETVEPIWAGTEGAPEEKI